MVGDEGGQKAAPAVDPGSGRHPVVAINDIGRGHAGEGGLQAPHFVGIGDGPHLLDQPVARDEVQIRGRLGEAQDQLVDVGVGPVPQPHWARMHTQVGQVTSQFRFFDHPGMFVGPYPTLQDLANGQVPDHRRLAMAGGDEAIEKQPRRPSPIAPGVHQAPKSTNVSLQQLLLVFPGVVGGGSNHVEEAVGVGIGQATPLLRQQGVVGGAHHRGGKGWLHHQRLHRAKLDHWPGNL